MDNLEKALFDIDGDINGESLDYFIMKTKV